MVRGLYTAWTGMNTEQKRLDIITNNLANASTAAYKKDGVTSQSFDNVLAAKIKDTTDTENSRVIGTMNLGVKLGEVYTDYDQGSLKETGNPLDIALEGRGFFAIRSSYPQDGIVRYTRDGSFTQNRDGDIVDMNGNQLLGEAGLLSVPVGSSIAISTDGYVYADGQFIDRLLISDFENYESLEKVGNSMYQTTDGTIPLVSNTLVHQGFIEQSNVNVVSEMVKMITITRAYETNQKVIQTIDGTLDLAANSVGRV